MQISLLLTISIKVLICIVLFGIAEASQSSNANHKYADRKLVIVTIDGLRWLEVFYGADAALLQNPDFVKNIEHTTAQFWHEDAAQRPLKLMPFLTHVIAQQGSIIGDREKGSYMRVTNQHYFSYPGYNEIFSGVADNRITSNAKRANPNVTFLEWLHNREPFTNNMGIFSGWDVFPYIYNRARSGMLINAGFEAFELPTMTDKVRILNQLQQEIPSPWATVRHDAFTYGFAKEYLLSEQPKVLVINLGETDDFAHDGHYDAYLSSAQQTDRYLQDLWRTLNSLEAYKNKTNMLIISDHGRGNTAKDWTHHASKLAIKNYMTQLSVFEDGIVGAEQIWFAAIGPDIKKQGLVTSPQEQTQSQFAATALGLLGFDVSEYNTKAAPAIQGIINE